MSSSPHQNRVSTDFFSICTGRALLQDMRNPAINESAASNGYVNAKSLILAQQDGGIRVVSQDFLGNIFALEYILQLISHSVMPAEHFENFLFHKHEQGSKAASFSDDKTVNTSKILQAQNIIRLKSGQLTDTLQGLEACWVCSFAGVSCSRCFQDRASGSIWRLSAHTDSRPSQSAD